MQTVLLSLALVLGLGVSSRTNFESLALALALRVKSLALALALALKVKALALALSKSPWPWPTRSLALQGLARLVFRETNTATMLKAFSSVDCCARLQHQLQSRGCSLRVDYWWDRTGHGCPTLLETLVFLKCNSAALGRDLILVNC